MAATIQPDGDIDMGYASTNTEPNYNLPGNMDSGNPTVASLAPSADYPIEISDNTSADGDENMPIDSDDEAENMSIDSDDDEIEDDNLVEPPVEDADDDIHTDIDIFEEEYDDESSLDSLSTCYEELDGGMSDAEILYVERVKTIPPPKMPTEDDDLGSDMSNWSVEPYDGSVESYDCAFAEIEEDAAVTGGEAILKVPSSSTVSRVSLPTKNRNNTSKPPLTFAALEAHKFAQMSWYEEKYDWTRWEVKGIEEALSTLLRERETAQREVQEAEKSLQRAREDVFHQMEDSGISQELYSEYEAFCASLDPQYGQRGGFSVETFGEHNGDYIQYDPNFQIFKESVESEMPYNDRNFRVEAPIGDPSGPTMYPLCCGCHHWTVLAAKPVYRRCEIFRNTPNLLVFTFLNPIESRIYRSGTHK